MRMTVDEIIRSLSNELEGLRREYDKMEAERDAADDRRDEMVDDLEVERQRADSEMLRAEKAEAAIARVRELCRQSWAGKISYDARMDVLRALDGAE